MVVEPGKTYIRTLRAIGPVHDRLAFQVRLNAALSATALHPAGLPAFAIVLIRKLRSPLPGTFRGGRDGLGAPLAWDQAVTSAIERLIRGAARPVRGPVPAAAEAILFLDRSEFLACLASDWCDGSAVTRWWWQSLFEGTDIARAVLRAWLDAPEYLPAALQLMAGSANATPFVQTLSHHTALSLLQSVTRRFALRELQLALETTFNEGHGVIHDQADVLKTKGVARPLGPPPPALPAPQGPPWQAWVPESQGRHLSLEQQCLLGIGLMLQRAPRAVRSPAFAPALLAWLQTASVTDDKVAGPAINSAAHTPALLMAQTDLMADADKSGESFASEEGRVARADTPRRAQTLLSSNPAMPPQPTDIVSAATPPQPTDIVSAAAPPQPPGTATAAILQPPGVAPVPTLAQEHRPIGRVEPLTMPAQTTPLAEQTHDAANLIDAVIDTELGGLFYLINLGLFLGLYGDFTTPAQPGIVLSIWDFVALLGQQLVGERLQQDPLWLLLARLAGRSGQEEPGHGFDPPHAWRLPEEWLKPFPESGPWLWAVAHGRLRVRHPEPFWVLDVPKHAGSPRQQLQHELQTYRNHTAFQLQRVVLSGGVDGIAPLERWLGWLMSYVRARLERALGVADAADLAHILCEHPGRVYITPTHLDISLALEALPIAIRLAGLDRNPGWVPAAGRYIAFHFE